MHKHLTAKIFNFVSEFTSYPEASLTLMTRVREDLGIDGDDAIEFLKKYSQRFGTDLRDLQYTRYFVDEAGFTTVLWVFRKLRPRKHKTESMTIADLVDAAEAGHWISR